MRSPPWDAHNLTPMSDDLDQLILPSWRLSVTAADTPSARKVRLRLARPGDAELSATEATVRLARVAMAELLRRESAGAKKVEREPQPRRQPKRPNVSPDVQRAIDSVAAQIAKEDRLRPRPGPKLPVGKRRGRAGPKNVAARDRSGRLPGAPQGYPSSSLELRDARWQVKGSPGTRR